MIDQLSLQHQTNKHLRMVSSVFCTQLMKSLFFGFNFVTFLALKRIDDIDSDFVDNCTISDAPNTITTRVHTDPRLYGTIDKC